MKSSGIGGQAVLEGVMMRNRGKYAVAVRKADGSIYTDTKTCKTSEDRNAFFRLPIIRGVVAFIDSMYLGVTTLTFSSDILEQEEDTSNDSNGFYTVITVLLAVLLAVGLFMVLPLFLSELFRRQIHNTTVLAVLEGLIRLVLFISYVFFISRMEDIKRVFMYHGAEHKAINCVESGKELSVENVKKQSRFHKRCGTSFMLFVMIISIFFFIIIHVGNIWLRMLYRLLLVPVIAGVSYELIRFAGSHDGAVIDILSKPGWWLQSLTTKEPDGDMIEVAIASVEAVFDWKAYQEQLERQKERKTDKKPAKKKSRAQRAADIARREEERAKRRKEEEEELRMQEETEQKLRQHLEAKRKRKQKLEQEKAKKVSEDTTADETEEDAILTSLDRYFVYEEEEVAEESEDEAGKDEVNDEAQSTDVSPKEETEIVKLAELQEKKAEASDKNTSSNKKKKRKHT